MILRRLAGGTALTVLFHTFVANLISTALGAALYFVTMPLVGDPLFYWWFKGEFASEAVRNACIALIFAVVLWGISWSSETMVIARLRKTSFKIISAPSAWANLATYILLLGLSLLSQH